jgi:hypothetical protein
MRRKLLIVILSALLTVCHVGASPAGSKTLSENDLLKLLAGGVYTARIASLVRYRGINFVPTAHDLELLQRAGANNALLHEVLTAPRVLPQVMQRPLEPPAQRQVTPRPISNAISSIGQNAADLSQAASNSSKLGVAILSRGGLEAFQGGYINGLGPRRSAPDYTLRGAKTATMY